MKRKALVRRPVTWTAATYGWLLLLMVGLLGIAACAPKPITPGDEPSTQPQVTMEPEATPSAMASSTDPRVGLKAGLYDAGEASWNLDLLSTTPSAEGFVDHGDRPGVVLDHVG